MDTLQRRTAAMLGALDLREDDASGALQNPLEVRSDLDSLAGHLVTAA